MKRTAAFVVASLVLCVLGLSAIASTRVNVVWYRGRPWLLKFGPTEALGRCRVCETADPTSDVLCNLVDVDADGRPELRACGFIDGSPPSCEERVALGFWAARPVEVCRAGAAACGR